MELGRGEPNYFLLGSLRFSHRCRWQYGYWCKQNNWETGTRVPLIISAPWLPASHGRVERSLVESTDLLPTLVEVAGLPPALPTAGGPPIDGSSMARFLAPGGESVGWKDERCLLLTSPLMVAQVWSRAPRFPHPSDS